MTVQTHALLTAIGNQLRADHFPALPDPLPGELKDLLAQFVALEVEKQGLTKRSATFGQSAIAPPPNESLIFARQY